MGVTMRKIPVSVVDRVRWLTREPGVPRQKMRLALKARRPTIHGSGIPGSWDIARRQLEAQTVRIALADAIRWALYEWRSQWTQEELVDATVQVTKAVMPRQEQQVRVIPALLAPVSTPDALYRAMATVDAYLRVVEGVPGPPDPAFAAAVQRLVDAPRRAIGRRVS